MRIAAVILSLLLIAGCTDKDKLPSGVIPRDEMTKILWDMMQADQYASLYVTRDSIHANVKTETLKLYQDVFRLHKISREDFRSSFLFYQGRPDLSRTMFDSLLAKGNRLRTEGYSKPPTPPTTPPVNTTMSNGQKMAVSGSLLHNQPPGSLGNGGRTPLKRPVTGSIPAGNLFLRKDSARALRVPNNPAGPPLKVTHPQK